MHPRLAGRESPKRAHNRKSSARSVRGDGVTATPNVQTHIIAGAMPGTLEHRLSEVNHRLLGP
jgi:hypothetical protein